MAHVCFIYGAIVMISGLIIRKTRENWMTRAQRYRPVDIEKYTKFMGILGIVTGIVCIALGFFHLYSEITAGFFLITVLVYVILSMYCERKYGRKKHINSQRKL